MSDLKKAGPMALQGNTGFATSLALLLIRLVLGWLFFYHGSQKVFGWFTPNGEPMVGMLAKGITLPVLPAEVWAWMAALGELLGGAFVLLGLLTRLATLPLIVTMLVAIATVHGKNGFGGSFEMGTLDTGKMVMIQHTGYEMNLVLIAMAGALLLTGPGLISADAFIFRRGLWARGPQPLGEPGKRGGS